MKIFWALIVVLVASTGVLLAKRGNDGSIAGSTVATADRRVPQAVPQPIASATETSDSAGAALNIDPQGLPDLPAAAGNATSAIDPNDSPDDPIVVEVGIPDLPVDPATLTGDPAPLGNDAAVTTDATETADDDPAADLIETPADPAAEPHAIAETTITSPADTETTVDAGDALLLNDRYRITGEGTADSPYVIDFDMLIAVEQDYAPKEEGKKEIPEWIKTIDGKHVNITGFVAFPFLSATAEECMVMLNQWDGCCIGVPPTPYDAVEVQLAEPLDLNRGIPNYGTISGVFRTDPYLVNGWLIGLYVMDDAKLMSSGSRNQTGF